MCEGVTDSAFLQPPPADNLLQAVELLYALQGQGSGYVRVLVWWLHYIGQ